MRSRGKVVVAVGLLSTVVVAGFITEVSKPIMDWAFPERRLVGDWILEYVDPWDLVGQINRLVFEPDGTIRALDASRTQDVSGRIVMEDDGTISFVDNLQVRERYWESLKGVVDGNRLIVEDQNGYLQTWQFSFPSKDRLNLEGMLPATTATYRRRRPQQPPLQRR